MKALGSRCAFLIGFLVGTCTLYVFLRQVWFERTFSTRSRLDGLEKTAAQLRELEEDSKNWKKERSALFNLNHPHHKGEDSHMADELYKKVRILCWVMTGPNNLQKKARHVKNTWSRHCNVVVFMSSVDDPDFPTVGLGTKEGRDQLYWKTIRAFHYALENHGDEADWFLKADDDTYVVVDNLRWVLANHTPEEPIYFGRRFKPYTKQGYMSGGAGYVLSKEALKRFVEGFKTKVCTHTTHVEDLAMGQCMEKVGVVAGDARDTVLRETFHPFVPEQHLTSKFPKSFWYWSYCYYPISEPGMAQWEKLRQLESVYLTQVDELYDGEAFPMDVRHYLAHWIEGQDWDRAARDHDVAMVLFQVLLENLDIQHSRFVQGGESFLLQHNIRRFKHSFQRYQEEPYNLASIIQWFLAKEKEILQNAELAEQVQLMQVQQNPMETDSQRNIERKMADLKNKVQCMEHTVKCMEEQQDEFDFKYQTHNMEGTTNEAEKTEQMKVLQALLNRLDASRKSMLSGIGVLLDGAEELLCVLVREELVQWQRRQQKACIGAPDSTCLDQLEKWFTTEAECLFQVRKFLKKLEELMGKVTYEHDPVKKQKPALQKRVDSLLTSLLKSAFVVETQPSMPQGKGPLVLRTNVQFSVKTRFLVKFPELNHAMKVNVSMDREAPLVKGYRRFNVLGTNSKALNMAESMSGGMVADFRHLTLKEQKSGGGGKGVHDLSLSVTEELHIINFFTEFLLHDVSVSLETSSLPVVIISNSSQQQSAWASILWFNMLCLEPKNLLFFANCPVAMWPQLGEMLSWQFLSSTTRGLESNQLDMIAHKLFGKQQNYDACKISWTKFSKENVPNTNFTFWVWFDGILLMVKSHLENLWKDGSIMGFVSKGKEKTLLKKKQRGTFLLRFSESIRDGGITFSWVDYSPTGEPDVRSVQPFTKVDLGQIPFHEIIRNFQILEEENVPENPLLFLYPDTPKVEAFGKYYTEKSGADSQYIKYIKTKLVFVSKEITLEAKSPMYSDIVEGEDSGPMNPRYGLGEEAFDLSGDPLPPELPLSPDPMFSVAMPDEDLIPTIQEFLNDPNMYECVDFLSDDTSFPEGALPGLPFTAPLQSCE